jgi:hypothetical protein
VTRDDNFPVRQPLHAGLRAPLLSGSAREGKITGVLELFSPQIAHPDEDLFQMVEALGNQIGLHPPPADRGRIAAAKSGRIS